MKNKISIFMLILICSFIPDQSISWDGYDYDSGNYVEIDKGNLVRPGREIEYYDYGSGDYKTADVESIRSNGSSVEVEIYDHESGEYRTLEMDR